MSATFVCDVRTLGRSNIRPIFKMSWKRLEVESVAWVIVRPCRTLLRIGREAHAIKFEKDPGFRTPILQNINRKHTTQHAVGWSST
ncbi:hypothetical protein NDU88_008308 [Pleurodeles waltl]|uniref:Uncharacterized protein n=1 Tax=Pleurodeles waltl TaxID=8319 RepID=A0AAV7N6P9_PLEWA|nr:hypothetical protein NDU88_008308 [Pleurodeles waltl]